MGKIKEDKLPKLTYKTLVKFSTAEQLEQLKEAYNISDNELKIFEGAESSGYLWYDAYKGRFLVNNYPGYGSEIYSAELLLADIDDVTNIVVDNNSELQDVTNAIIGKKWEGALGVRITEYPIYLTIAKDKAVWSNSTQVISDKLIHVDKYLARVRLQKSITDIVQNKQPKYTLEAGGVKIELTGKFTISSEEGTWTFGKEG